MTMSSRGGGYLAAAAVKAGGMGVEEIYVDPGIGFGKRVRDNVALLKAIPDLVDQGVPVLVGTSRKSIIGTLRPACSGPPSVQRTASRAHLLQRSGRWRVARRWCGSTMLPRR